MKHLFLILSILVLALAGGLALGSSSAEASVPRYSFKTEDGKYDGEIGDPNKSSNIQIELVSPVYLKTSSGSKKLTDYIKIQVRLVNAKTGKSTGYHKLTGGKTLFKGMKTGEFYVDVKDGYASGKVTGKLDILFMN